TPAHRLSHGCRPHPIRRPPHGRLLPKVPTASRAFLRLEATSTMMSPLCALRISAYPFAIFHRISRAPPVDVPDRRPVAMNLALLTPPDCLTANETPPVASSRRRL